jgi:hypothetical protein
MSDIGSGDVAVEPVAAKPPINLAAFDLVEACNKPYKLELLHPVSKAPLGSFIYIVGKDSDICRDYSDEKANEKLRRRAAIEKKGGDAEVVTVEQSRHNGTELLAVCTVGFENINAPGPITFSTHAAYTLYTQLPWIRKQVDAAIVDIENFLKV